MPVVPGRRQRWRYRQRPLARHIEHPLQTKVDLIERHAVSPAGGVHQQRNPERRGVTAKPSVDLWQHASAPSRVVATRIIAQGD
jgi:hypothetical protein